MRSTLLAAFGLMLAACTSNYQQNMDPNILPTGYRQEVLDTLSSTLIDPTNVHDAFISDPVMATVSREPRYTVCVRYNARNEARQYAGSTDRIGIFYGGHLNQLIEPTNDQCAKAAYRPFPELEKLCLAKKCE
ncbi:MAG TPA: hypothetical protein VGC38_02105 [Pseudolabrys sp.]